MLKHYEQLIFMLPVSSTIQFKMNILWDFAQQKSNFLKKQFFSLFQPPISYTNEQRAQVVCNCKC